MTSATNTWEARVANSEVASDLALLLSSPESSAVAEIERAAIADGQLPVELLDATTSPDDATRYGAFRTLIEIGDRRPDLVSREWSRWAAMLSSPNSYHRTIALHALVRAAAADPGDRFEPLLDRLLSLLDDESVVTARHLAQHAGRIVRTRPDLEGRVTERLLAIDATHHRQTRRELIKADIVASFAEYAQASPSRSRIIVFVEEQLRSSSPKTRAAAKAFLRQHRP
jgi:hypothetical protein